MIETLSSSIPEKPVDTKSWYTDKKKKKKKEIKEKGKNKHLIVLNFSIREKFRA